MKLSAQLIITNSMWIPLASEIMCWHCYHCCTTLHLHFIHSAVCKHFSGMSVLSEQASGKRYKCRKWGTEWKYENEKKSCPSVSSVLTLMCWSIVAKGCEPDPGVSGCKHDATVRLSGQNPTQANVEIITEWTNHTGSMLLMLSWK